MNKQILYFVSKFNLSLFILIVLLNLLSGCSDKDDSITNSATEFNVKILNPSKNQQIADSITIEIEATDIKGITNVELYIDNVKVKEFPVKPYKYFWDVKNLTDSSLHSIHAKAFNSDDKVIGSEVITVVVNRLSPSDLRILHLTKGNVSIEWNDRSIIEDAYIIQVSSDSLTFTTIHELPPNTTNAIVNYNFNHRTKYYFKVGAKINNHVSFSQIQSAITFPDAPILISPLNNSIDVQLNENFIWNESDGADNYLLQISDNNNFNSFFYNENVGDVTSKQVFGLNYGTKYYWRVIAINNFNGLMKSNEWELRTVEFVCGNSSILYSGKIYNTVQIGNQCWLKENLNVGVFVPSINTGNSHSEVSNNNIIEKYCYDNSEANCDLYGGLYDWNELMNYVLIPGTKGICPDGWHIPTVEDFQILKSEVGGDGNALKAVGQGSGIAAGTNTSGFTALLSGWRLAEGSFSGFGSYTNYWSSSRDGLYKQWYVNLAGASLYGRQINLNSKDYTPDGFCVRCIKD